jgi:hypothetical protein
METLRLCILHIVAALILFGGALPAARAQFPVLPTQPGPGPTVQPAPPPALAEDVTKTKIRQEIEKQGLKVLEIWYESGGEGHWSVITAASYAQPSAQQVVRQAYLIWGAMFTVLGPKESSVTVISGHQAWTRYRIIFHAHLGPFTILVNALGRARTDEERRRAYDEFNKGHLHRHLRR